MHRRFPKKKKPKEVRRNRRAPDSKPVGDFFGRPIFDRKDGGIIYKDTRVSERRKTDLFGSHRVKGPHGWRLIPLELSQIIRAPIKKFFDQAVETEGFYYQIKGTKKFLLVYPKTGEEIVTDRHKESFGQFSQHWQERKITGVFLFDSRRFLFDYPHRHSK